MIELRREIVANTEGQDLARRLVALGLLATALARDRQFEEARRFNDQAFALANAEPAPDTAYLASGLLDVAIAMRLKEEVTMSKINNALKVCFFVLVALVVFSCKTTPKEEPVQEQPSVEAPVVEKPVEPVVEKPVEVPVKEDKTAQISGSRTRPRPRARRPSDL